MLTPPVNGKIQGLFKAFQCFQVLFTANLIFKDFQDSLVYSSHFQACASPVSEITLNLANSSGDVVGRYFDF